MNAMVATRWGEPSELEYREVSDPEPGLGTVLVETRPAGGKVLGASVRRINVG